MAFGFGGRHGRGVAVCRKDGGKVPWGAPAMIGGAGVLADGSLGVLFRTPSSVEHRLKDKLSLGDDVTAAARPKELENVTGQSFPAIRF